MIDINKLTKEDIGKYVIYKGFCRIELGKIKSFNKKHVFVVYECSNDWENFEKYIGTSTDPENLHFANMKSLKKRRSNE